MNKQNLRFFIDFDGTITKVDTLQMILDEFAAGDWRSIEDQVTAGKLSDQESLQAEFDLVDISFETALTFLMDRVRIDESFPEFVDWCSDLGFPLTILSGGFRRIIDAVLNKFLPGSKLTVFSSAVSVENNTWTVIPAKTPRINRLCNHCKTFHLQQVKSDQGSTVYIGDGNTDRCPAQVADICFAKGALAAYLDDQDKSFIKFTTFSEIIQYFDRGMETKYE